MGAPKKQDYTKDYEFSMHDAHRRPAQIVRTPSLTSHHAYRRPDNLSDDNWYVHIEVLILSLLRQGVSRLAQNVGEEISISNLHEPPTKIDHVSCGIPRNIELLRNTYEFSKLDIEKKKGSGPEKGRYEALILAGFWEKKQYSIRIEVFEEYFTMTSIIDLEALAAESDASDSRGALGRVIKKLNARLAAIGGNATNGKLEADKAFTGDVKDVYENLFNHFEDEVIASSFNTVTQEPGSIFAKLLPAKAPLNLEGTLFVNFRGLVLRIADVPGEEKGKTYPIYQEYGAALGNKDRYSFESMISGATGQREANPNMDSMTVDSALSLLLAQSGVTETDPWQQPFEPTEYTFSTFFKKRFIYGSGFGPQLGQSNTPSPLYYVVICLHDNWRETGNVILRLHSLGTLRLAAMFELRKFMGRDVTLSNLQKELQELAKIGDREKFKKHRMERLPESIVDAIKNLSSKGQECAKKLDSLNVLTPINKILKRNLTGLASEYLNGFFLWRHLRPSTYWKYRKVFRVLVELKNELISIREEYEKEQEAGTDGARELLFEIRSTIRKIELFEAADSHNGYTQKALDHVRRALSDMDNSVRDGITYRSIKATYARQRFVTLAEDMNIGSVPGFLQYDLFVKHRLDRAYGLMQAISERFRHVSAMETQMRQELKMARSVEHQETLQKLQSTAEFLFFVVLAPYYISHTYNFLPEHYKVGEFWEMAIRFSPFAMIFLYFLYRVRKNWQRHKK